MKHSFIILSFLFLFSLTIISCKIDNNNPEQIKKNLENISNNRDVKDEGSGVTTDSSGNIYVTGKTGGGLDGNTSSGGSDIFLVKYNSSGTKQ